MKIVILGAGSWGLTLTWLFASIDDGREVWLWDRKPEKADAIRANRNLTFPVPVNLQSSVHVTSDLNEAIQGCDIAILAVTTKGTRETLQKMKATGELRDTTILVNTSKGLEAPGLVPLSFVFKEEVPNNPFAVLSGPTLAKEILNGLPTAAAIASTDLEVSEHLQRILGRENLLRLYSNTDVLGVELGGALKNIFAIASGYMVAKNLGENARSALITRGLVEMTRLSVALGAEEQSLYGLSGLGDLLATCNSPLSRNFQVGFQMAQGKTLDSILDEMKVVAEGVNTTSVVAALSRKMKIDAPIVDMVMYCISGNPLDDEMLIKSLMSRKLKAESAPG